MTDKNEKLYTKREIAELFNLTERRIEQMAQKKLIPKVARGMFDLVPTVQAYIRYLQGLANGPADKTDLEERLLLAQTEEREAKARMANYEADVMESKLLKLDDVAQQWTGRYVELKASLLEFPKRAAFRFTDPEVRLLVEEEAVALVTEILDRYSRDGILPDSALVIGDTEEGFKTAKTDNRKRVGKRKQNAGNKELSPSGALEDE